MNLKIYKSKLKGAFNVPPSKSHSIRAIVLACFANGKSKLENILNSGDTQTAIKIFTELDCTFKILNEYGDAIDIEIIPPSLGLVKHIQSHEKENFVIDCGNSGTLLYFLSVIFSFCEGKSFYFIGDCSLKSRPITPITEIFIKRNLDFKSKEDKLPLTFKGRKDNKLSLNLDGRFSQSISGLFLATAIYNLELNLNLKILGEAPYVIMTYKWLDSLGFNFKSFDCEKNFFEFNATDKKLKGFNKKIFSDWSAVAFPTLASIATKSKLTINAIVDKTQGDYKLLEYLNKFGVQIVASENGFTILEKQNLQGAKIDLADTPDLLPVICAIASLAKGDSEIINVEIARYKETDRVYATCNELKKFGVQISETPNAITIQGLSNKYTSETSVDSYEDHRIAMMLIAFALGSENVTKIKNYDCYKISFPSFLSELKKCGGSFSID